MLGFLKLHSGRAPIRSTKAGKAYSGNEAQKED